MQQPDEARGAGRLPYAIAEASSAGVPCGALQIGGVLGCDDAGEAGVHGVLLVLGSG
jgi:hypothetical protein